MASFFSVRVLTPAIMRVSKSPSVWDAALAFELIMGPVRQPRDGPLSTSQYSLTWQIRENADAAIVGNVTRDSESEGEGFRTAAREWMTCMYMCIHVCGCMFAPRCRARFTLYGARGQTQTHRANHMEDVERGDVQPFCPFASLPGSACHEGELRVN